MEKLGLRHLPPSPHREPLVASHFYLRPSRTHSFPLKADREQSTPAECGYRAAVLTAQALNVLFLLTAYQAKLCNSYAHTRDQATWDKITSVADLFLSVQRSAVQACHGELCSPGMRLLAKPNQPLRQGERHDAGHTYHPGGHLRFSTDLDAGTRWSQEEETLRLKHCLPRRPLPLAPPAQRKEPAPAAPVAAPCLQKRTNPPAPPASAGRSPWPSAPSTSTTHPHMRYHSPTSRGHQHMGKEFPQAGLSLIAGGLRCSTGDKSVPPRHRFTATGFAAHS